MNKNYSIEIVRDFDNSYYVNMSINDVSVLDVEEYVSYNVIKKQVQEKYGIVLPFVKDLTFTKWGRKAYSQLLEGTC